MTAAFLAVVAAVALVAVIDWRKGVLLAIPIGFLQDTVRKVTPGESVIWLMTVVACFAACYAGLILRERRLGVTGLLAFYQRLQAPILLFLALVLVQVGAAAVRTGSPIVAGIGLLSYLSPPFLLVLGVRYSARLDDWRRWILVYVGSVCVVAFSVGLQYAGFRSPFLRSIGVDVVFGTGGRVEMMGGMMRSSEVSAWHLAAAFCLCVVGVTVANRFWHRIAGAMLASGFLVALVLTGRRKMLGEIVLFGLLFAILLVGHRRGFSRLLRIVTILTLATVVALQLFPTLGGQRLNPYIERSLSVITDAGERLGGLAGLGTLQRIVERNGFFGSGAGTGSQGAQHFGGGAAVVGGAAEGGLGKILAELGIPGLVVLLWLAFAFAGTLLGIGRLARRLPDRFAVPTYGIMAFLPANLAVFLTAHQVFGDPFVLIVLGWLMGLLLAVPRVAQRAGLLRAPVRSPSSSPRAASVPQTTTA